MRNNESELAKRARAGIIGTLTACTCLYPLVTYETLTGHDTACQEHTIAMSFHAAREHDPDRARPPIVALNPTVFSAVRVGDGWRGRCRSCEVELVAGDIPELARKFGEHRHEVAP